MGDIMSSERLGRVVEDLVEKVRRWQKPESVGTSRVNTVVHSSPQHDMVFIECGGEDITKEEFVFTPAGVLHQGDVVEVIIQRKRGPVRKSFLFPPCRVAIRRFTPDSFGRITKEDEKNLSLILTNPSNQKEPFYSRAFYRKFFEGAKESLTPLPNIGY